MFIQTDKLTVKFTIPINGFVVRQRIQDYFSHANYQEISSDDSNYVFRRFCKFSVKAVLLGENSDPNDRYSLARIYVNELGSDITQLTVTFEEMITIFQMYYTRFILSKEIEAFHTAIINYQMEWISVKSPMRTYILSQLKYFGSILIACAILILLAIPISYAVEVIIPKTDLFSASLLIDFLIVICGLYLFQIYHRKNLERKLNRKFKQSL